MKFISPRLGDSISGKGVKLGFLGNCLIIGSATGLSIIISEDRVNTVPRQDKNQSKILEQKKTLICRPQNKRG